MGSRTIGVAVVAALLATAGLASAQASFSVTVEAQEDPGQVPAGSSASVPLMVQLQGDGFSCAENEDFPVELSVDGGGAGVTGSVDPAEIVFGNSMGVHNSDTPAGGYNESEEATLTVDTQATASGSQEITVTGVFPGGNYGPPEGTCSGEFPSAEDTANVPVTVQAQNDNGTGGQADGDTGGDGDGGEDGGEDEDGIPFGPWTAPLGLIAAALLLRRS